MSIEILVIYFLAVNYISALICIFDKHQSKAHKHRVSEVNLFLLSIAGGALSMYIAMQGIRHKTKKKRFMIGLPVIILCQLAFAIFYFFF